MQSEIDIPLEDVKNGLHTEPIKVKHKDNQVESTPLQLTWYLPKYIEFVSIYIR